MKIFFRFLGDVVTQRLEGVEHSDSKFKNNWLIYLIHVNNLPVYATDSDEGMQNYLNCNASDLKKKPDDPDFDVSSDDKAHMELDLYTSRRYFGTIRNLYTHLSNIARKWVCISNLA